MREREELKVWVDKDVRDKLEKHSRKLGCNVGEVLRRLVQSANLPGLDPSSKVDRQYMPEFPET